MFTSFDFKFPPIPDSVFEVNKAFVQAVKDNDLEKVQAYCKEKQNKRSYEEACISAVSNYNLVVFTLLVTSYKKQHDALGIHMVPDYIMECDALDILIYYLQAYELSRVDLIKGSIEYQGSYQKFPVKCLNYILSTVDFNEEVDVCNSLLYRDLSRKLQFYSDTYHDNADFLELCKTSYKLALHSANNSVYSLEKYMHSNSDFVSKHLSEL